MRSEAEIQDRIRFLLTRELDRRVSEAGARLPRNCVHNHRQSLDTRKEVAGEPNENYNRNSSPDSPIIGLCLLNSTDPTEWNGDICEEPIDAQRCPHFNLKITQESISEEFYQQIRDLDWVAENMAEVYGLLWALGSETMPTLPWWKRIWFRFLRIRPDPLVATLPPESIRL